MEKDIFEEVIVQLQKMEEIEKLDLSIVDNLNRLIELCKHNEQIWIENEAVATRDAFLLFHASRNSRLILQRMKRRFISADKMHENPKVVKDAIYLLPMLNELCYVTSSLIGKTITPEIRLFISERLRSLRNVAFRLLMLPSLEEEMEDVDKRKLKRHFDRFANSLQARSIEI